MDDFNLSTLTESRNEYCALLLSKLTPHIITGIYSVFDEAFELCVRNDETNKYLMTFQNFLGRVTRWNQGIINNETERIKKNCNCNYLEDLLTCVHVTQLKLLTSVRVGTKQKKIDIDIPKLNVFIHQVYIQFSRKIYKNVFLFDKYAPPLQKQKNMRELETIAKECILTVIRESMPLETILRSYLDETEEDNVEEIIEEVKEEIKDINDNLIKDVSDCKKNEVVVKEPGLTEKKNSELKRLEDEITNHIEEQNNKLEFNKDTTNKPDNQQLQLQERQPQTQQPQQPQKLKATFDDDDKVVEFNKDDQSTEANRTKEQITTVSKDIENLEKISDARWDERNNDDDDDDNDEEYKLKIFDDNENLKLDVVGLEPLEQPKTKQNLFEDDEVIVLN